MRDGEEVHSVDLTDRDLYRDGFPHELFTDLRGRSAVLRHAPAVTRRGAVPIGFWVVLRHAEVQRVARDTDTFSASDGPSIVATAELRGHTLTHSDGPDHLRLRRLISAGFTPRMIGRLEDQIRVRTDQILDDIAAAGECDFVRDVAYLLPMQLIGDIIGIPEADRPWVFAQTDAILRRAADAAVGASDAERQLFAYAQQLSEDKRRQPADDVWSLLAAMGVDQGDGAPLLSGLELDYFFTILSIAGSETTRNAISHGLLALLDHPDQLTMLRVASLGGDIHLLDTATEEAIRWASPVTCFTRTATRDVELGDAMIRAGDRVTTWYPSANRDERAFDDPFRFDLTRSPNPHVSFGGGGAHFCLGAQLARREVRVMFEQLMTRFDTIELTGPITYAVNGLATAIAVSVEHAPVRLVTRSPSRTTAA